MPNKIVLTWWFFTLLSIFIVSLILYNTYQFFTELKENERQKMQIWAAAQKEFTQLDITSLDNNSDTQLILDIVVSNSSTPMLLHAKKEDSYSGRNIDEELLKDEAQVAALIEKFSSEYTPIDVSLDGSVIQTIYYGNSPIINKIKYYPAALILIIFLFFLALYFFYQTSKSSEQNRLWAGMAKETAHQIGTPLSSLVGWTEILKSEQVNPEYISEIEKDIDRLKTITDRFSKIGSVPNLEREDIVSETQKTFAYLTSRTSKLIEFNLVVPKKPIMVDLNSQLYSWTLENLVKNGIDAMKGQGVISARVVEHPRKVSIQIEDTGKGIPKKDQKRIFNPGFTTKKRGWGLGLSLSKRIIQDYHNGKIHVLKSIKNEGSIIEITLPLPTS